MLSSANYWDRLDQTVVLPGESGAHNWQAMAFNPKEGLVYIPVSIVPVRFRRDSQTPGGIQADWFYGLRSDARVKAKGMLLAWDPIAQKERWHVVRRVPMNGGALATAGNLVFQGTAEGRFEAFAADTGKKLWSFDSHGSIQGAPSSIELDGTQMILVPSGDSTSSATSHFAARLLTTRNSLGPPRLLAFTLDAQGTVPDHQEQLLRKPNQPWQPEETARRGSTVYQQYQCDACHGAEAVNAGAGIPDLRAVSKERFQLMHEIVVGGLLRPAGMPSFPQMNDEELRALQAYLINQAWRGYSAQQRGR